MTADPTHRLFLGGMLTAPAMLSGCKLVDGLSAMNHPLRSLMEGTNRLPYEVQERVTNGTLATEYMPADIRQGMRLS